MTAEQFDCIVIGSGIGGLTTASLLARVARQRVLVLERHFKPGGFTHSFRRQQYEWDIGLHYVGQMQAGTLSRRIMDLVTGGQVDWHPLGSPYERFVFPEFSYEVPSTAERFERQLCEDFPDDRAGIGRYFRDMKAAESWGTRWYVGKQSSGWLARWLTWPGRRLASQTTQAYLSRFSNPKLRTILASQWPDMGTPPELSAFAFHALIGRHYFDGAFYPIGGSRRIGEAAVQVIERSGGRCLVNHPVEEILVQGGRAVGVRAVTRKGSVEFHAPLIVSDAGAPTTFQQLLPEPYCAAERQRAGRLKQGPSALILFLGLADNPRTRGFDDANYWIFEDQRHALRSGDASAGWKPDGVFLSFGSLRDPHAKAHTAQIIAFAFDDEWNQYADSQWKRRGEDYEARKQQSAQRLIDFVERRLPGLRSLIAYGELSTPLTVKSFTGHARGSIYGQLCDPKRLGEDGWRCTTSLPGLYLTGADVGMPGVNGAQMAGVMTAGRLLGPFGLPRIMLAAYGAKSKG